MDEPMEVDILNTNNDVMEWIVYERGKNTEPFDDWLQRYPPSTTEKLSGIGWICVRNEPKESWADEPDLNGLYDAWEEYIKVQPNIKYEQIKELALNYNVKSGKWLLFAESGGKIDHLWYIIAKAIIENQDLPCNSAKVSPHDGQKHVICIYNNDFSNYDQVMRSEQAIRNMGIKAKLLYKPDVFSYLGIYGGNRWGLTPNILSSNYDLLRAASVIEFTQGITQL